MIIYNDANHNFNCEIDIQIHWLPSGEAYTTRDLSLGLLDRDLGSVSICGVHEYDPQRGEKTAKSIA